MARNTAQLIVTLTVLVAASLATADLPDPDLSTATIVTSGGVLFVRPDGSGYAFDQAHLGNGTVVDATIVLYLVNALGGPWPGYPAEDLWLETTGAGLVHPAGGTIADGPTDAAGQTRWLQPPNAGGCTVGETVVVLVGGQPLNQAGLGLAFVSPDINGDLVVNLADLSLFAAGYTGTHDPCADLFYDGLINLSDLSLFSQSYGI
jgi:hypothetical protein